jgi:hypothetical protein
MVSRAPPAREIVLKSHSWGPLRGGRDALQRVRGPAEASPYRVFSPVPHLCGILGPGRYKSHFGADYCLLILTRVPHLRGEGEYTVKPT